MQSSSSELERVNVTRYSSCLTLCFFLGMGICCAILPTLPENPRFQRRTQGELTYAITRSCLSIALMLVNAYAYFCLRRKDHFHRSQEVFWPTRCLHCAWALGLVEGTRYCTLKDRRRSQLNENVLSGNSGESSLNGNRTRNSNENSFAGEQYDSKCNLPKQLDNRPLYKTQKRSLLHMYVIFGLFAVLNIPVQLVGVTICLVLNDNSPVRIVSLVAQAVLDVNFILVIVLSTVFFLMYHDAVFIDKNSHYLLLASQVALSVWVATIKIVYPIGSILNSPYNNVEYPCKLNNSFGSFLLFDEKMMTPFYAESGMIGAGILWNIWSAILPRTCIRIIDECPEFQSFNVGPRENLLRKFIRTAKGSVMKLRYIERLSKSDEGQCILQDERRIRESKHESSRLCLVMLCTLSGLFYFGLFRVIRCEAIVNVSVPTRQYIQFACEMAAYLPLIIMIHYKVFLGNTYKTFPLKRGISVVHGIVQKHDQILMLSCLGTFTLNIFRLVGSLGLLFHGLASSRDDLSMACFAAVYSIFFFHAIWKMTSFLMIAQRQATVSGDEAKWTNVCLVYTAVLNATQWFIDSINRHSWAVLTAFYGEQTGRVIGVLHHPICSLYYLHAAVVAINTYIALNNEGTEFTIN